MTRSFEMVPEYLKGYRDDGTLFFSSNAFPVSYAPEAEVIYLAAQVITFPNFNLGWAYCWQQWDGSSGSVNESAISLVTMKRQNWGPATVTPAPDNNIDEVVVGTIPDDADHIRVRVKLTRTTTPDQVNGNTVPVAFKEGEWVDCPGGSLLVEELAPYNRLITFYRKATDNGDGTRDVIMRLQQTTNSQTQSFYRPGNNPAQTGWIYGGTYGGNTGTPVAQIEAKGPRNDPSGVGGLYKQTGGSPASTTITSSYSSVYTGDIEITAGYAGINPTNAGADPNGAYVLYLGAMRSTVQDQTTWNSWTPTDISTSDEDAEREIVVGIVWNHNDTTARSVSSVTIGGVTASPIIQNQGTAFSERIGTEFWHAPVPTGSTATLEVVMSGSVKALEVEAWAAYNVASWTPFDSISSYTVNSAIALDTPTGQGFALALARTRAQLANIVDGNLDRTLYELQGIDNVYLLSDGWDATMSRAFQSTEGVAMSIASNSSGFTTSNVSPWIAVSLQ